MWKALNHSILINSTINSNGMESGSIGGIKYFRGCQMNKKVLLDYSATLFRSPDFKAYIVLFISSTLNSHF